MIVYLVACSGSHQTIPWLGENLCALSKELDETSMECLKALLLSPMTVRSFLELEPGYSEGCTSILPDMPTNLWESTCNKPQVILKFDNKNTELVLARLIKLKLIK